MDKQHLIPKAGIENLKQAIVDTRTWTDGQIISFLGGRTGAGSSLIDGPSFTDYWNACKTDLETHRPKVHEKFTTDPYWNMFLPKDLTSDLRSTTKDHGQPKQASWPDTC